MTLLERLLLLLLLLLPQFVAKNSFADRQQSVAVPKQLIGIPLEEELSIRRVPRSVRCKKLCFLSSRSAQSKRTCEVFEGNGRLLRVDSTWENAYNRTVLPIAHLRRIIVGACIMRPSIAPFRSAKLSCGLGQRCQCSPIIALELSNLAGSTNPNKQRSNKRGSWNPIGLTPPKDHQFLDAWLLEINRRMLFAHSWRWLSKAMHPKMSAYALG